MLECNNSRTDIILLCETFLLKNTEKLVDIPNYTLISNHRVNSKGGSTAILVRKGISYKWQPSLEIFEEKELESTLVEVVSKSGKKIIVSSLYRPPNTDPKYFNIKLNDLTSRLNLEKDIEVILGMDHNLDLLKSSSHKHTQ